MPKSQFIDPGKMLAPGFIKFQDIPVNQYNKTLDEELKIYGSVLHETINEYIRDEVIEDYVRWMDRRA